MQVPSAAPRLACGVLRAAIAAILVIGRHPRETRLQGVFAECAGADDDVAAAGPLNTPKIPA